MLFHQTHNSLGNYTYNAFFYDDCQWNYHFHKNYELIYVLEGMVELTLNDRVFSLEADTFALILPNAFHAYGTPEHSRVWIGVFSGDFVGEFAKLTEGKYTQDPRFHCKGSTRNYLIENLVNREPEDLLLLKATLYAVCREFHKHAILCNADRDREFIYKIITHVSEHFRDDLTLTDLSALFGYEYHYISRQFHKYFGMNFKQFLNTYRMEQAQEQLLHTDISITQIAHNAGFQTIRTFNRVFMEQTGVSPSNYRKNTPRLKKTQLLPNGSVSYLRRDKEGHVAK